MAQTSKVIELLKKHYPHAKTSLRHSNAFQMLVATILSAQCTDERVNIITKELFRKYKTPQDFEIINIKILEKLVRSTGFYKNKAKSIKGSAEMIIKKYGGRVPDSMEELLTLPGVARKTANVILSQAFGRNEGVVVDTHVKRLAYRLGLTKETNPEKIEKDLMQAVPKKEWGFFSMALIYHGRAVCNARAPACSKCFLGSLCPRVGVEKHN